MKGSRLSPVWGRRGSSTHVGLHSVRCRVDSHRLCDGFAGLIGSERVGMSPLASSGFRIWVSRVGVHTRWATACRQRECNSCTHDDRSAESEMFSAHVHSATSQFAVCLSIHWFGSFGEKFIHH